MTRYALVSSRPQRDQLRAAGVALLAGVVYTAAMYALAYRGGYAFGAETPAHLAFFLVWVTAGHVLLGAVPTYLFIRYGYLVPVVSFLFITGSVVESEVTPSVEGPLAVYAMVWVIPLVVVLAAAGIEHLVRTDGPALLG